MNAVEVLKNLIRFDTSNPPGNEMPALSYITGLIRPSGAHVALLPHADGRRGNLIARICCPNPALPALVLLSHIDVVPADASQWRHPPFEAVEDNGYIYGRGTVDTKQLTVMQLAAFLSLCDAGALRRDVYLVVTGDEECGSALGLTHLLAQTLPLGQAPIRVSDIFRRALVISEGGGFPILAGDSLFYLVETGQKGCGQATFTFHAPGGVYLTGTDALASAAGLVAELHDAVLDGHTGPVARQFEAALCSALACDGNALPALLSPMMRSILYAMRHNTVTPTLVQGCGLREVSVTCDVRLLPGYDQSDLVRLVAPLAQKWHAQMEIVSFCPGYESTADESLQILEHCLNQALPATGCVPLIPFLSMGSSDGRFLKPLQASVLGFSPVLATDMTFDQAVRMVHGINERIHRDSLTFGCRVLTHAVRRLSMAAEREGV